MPREAEIQQTQYGATRGYRLWYRDDPPERVEAVCFFQTIGDHPWLHPSLALSAFLHKLPIEEANEYLYSTRDDLTLTRRVSEGKDPRLRVGLVSVSLAQSINQHPLEEQYSCLVLWDGELIQDDDLRRFEYLPELEIVQLHSDNRTDAGVRHLRHLRRVEWLELYSTQVTDACLDVIRQLQTIRSLDLQGCPQLSQQKCELLIREMGVRQYWLPSGPAHAQPTPDRGGLK